MNFIKKIVDNKVDSLVHAQFQKFSKGEFRDKAIIKVKKTNKKYNVTTSAEFANELVKNVAEELSKNKTLIKGAIVSTSDLTDKLDFKDKKQFQGVKRYLIEKEMSGDEILKLLENFPKSFFALSFESEKSKLKIKPKAPKSAKAKSSEKNPKPDFCRLSTTNEALGQSFVIETTDFKVAEINHTFFIEDIIFPKGETDYSKIREMAKRKGRIVRTSIIDEKESSKEIKFEA
ncbi:hypothetical protein ISS08_00980 [Candidatus Pacearchaeota archaeon]|nr:hypothetical protein [Candidatus Pacearchaeota archaeon]